MTADDAKDHLRNVELVAEQVAELIDEVEEHLEDNGAAMLEEE